MAERTSSEELEKKLSALEKEREACSEKWLRDMEKHPRCALLPSPDLLDISINSRGSDRTDTLRDFAQVKEWVKKAGLLNTEFDGKDIYEQDQLEDGKFGSMITLAFNDAFAPMRNTANPQLEELVFWYYAGHGLSKERAQMLRYSATPCLDRVKLVPSHNDAAKNFVKENRKVKGGELCLHNIGFCDLHGLLKPWIAAIKSDSVNAKGPKKNKDLVIILDSCYSGIIARELEDFIQETEQKDATLLKENNVTIQAACGPDESALGGYFTPCFVYLNKPENKTLLNELKSDWAKMNDELRNKYKSIDLPSPMVVSTRAPSHDTTVEVSVQNFKLTLFQDPGFFKFCSTELYQKEQKIFLEKDKRVLHGGSANRFLHSQSFTVLDYKLKTYQGPGPGSPHAGTPMGLFLLDDPLNADLAVCAHIHFAKGDTTNCARINLVHHKKPPLGSTLYVEDDGLSANKVSRNMHKVPIRDLKEARGLVDACYQYVNKTEPGRWEDAAQWNMKSRQLGVNGLFRKKERSSWMCKYLKYIEKFDIPKVTKTCDLI